MADKKISQLTAVTTPLTGAEQIPAVQSAETKKVTVLELQSAPVSTGVANAVQYLNASKVPTTNSGLTFNGSLLEVNGDVQTTWASASTKFIGSKFSTTYALGVSMDTDNRTLTLYAKAADSTGTINFQTGVTPTTRLSVTNSGNVLVNTASQIASGKVSVASAESAFTAKISGNTGVGVGLDVERTVQNGDAAYFRSTTGLAGFITITGANTCTYNSVSDYRLKENVAPMTGALAKVAALKPVTYTWKSDGSDGQGFIAHELQAVIPDSVTGEKDATRTEKYEISPAIPATFDKDGKVIKAAVEAVMGEREVPHYQGVDTSLLVATLVAAMQEQQTLITQLQADVSALKGS
jgi:hypothetical protein